MTKVAKRKDAPGQVAAGRSGVRGGTTVGGGGKGVAVETGEEVAASERERQSGRALFPRVAGLINHQSLESDT